MKKIAYVLRTDTLRKEARVKKLTEYLKGCNIDSHVYAFVKTAEKFSGEYTNILCKSEAVRFSILRHVFKFVELQLRFLRLIYKERERFDTYLIANYEFIVAGFIAKSFFRVRIVVDLHEHYFSTIFKNKFLSKLLFGSVLDGVIFANRARMEDFIGISVCSPKFPAAIVRNFPERRGESTELSWKHIKADGDVVRIGIVGGIGIGRFVAESIKSLDREEFSEKVSIVTFGPETKFRVRHIAIEEKGPFVHNEIDVMISKLIDVSLVFYDPKINSNNRLCEPNRFFQSYNEKKVILTFYHESIKEFYDESVIVIDDRNFDESIVSAVRGLMAKSQSETERLRLVLHSRPRVYFEDGVENLEGLVLGSAASLRED